MITIDLPFPPSVNTYWRHPHSGKLAGRHLISDKGRRYRATVKYIAWAKGLPCIEGEVSVSIEAHMPDRRRRDLDNLLKAALDALVHAAIIGDDGDIIDLRISRAGVLKDGKIVVSISMASHTNPQDDP